jgi:hypothetical protein
MQPHIYKFLKKPDHDHSQFKVLECNEEFSPENTKFIVHDESSRSFNGLKLPKNPIIPDAIYDMVLDPEAPTARDPINIPQPNPLA